MTRSIRFDNETYRRLEVMYAAPDVAAQRRAVLDAIKLLPGETVLDIGCGPGFMVEEILPLVGPAGKVSAIDINEGAIELARARCEAYSNVEFQSADATALPYPDSSFDAIVSTQVYEYVRDLSAALRELYRVLHPGGRAVIMDTDWRTAMWHSSDCERMERIVKVWDEHLVDPILPRTLAKKLRDAGFVIHKQDVFVFLNSEFNSDTYSYGLAKMIGAFVPGRHGITKDEAIAWADDLQKLADSGDYFFSLNRYLFVGEKPAR
jgi:ubiquinone/menaquinone biosynthesis C-methylase UbiE